MDVKPILFNTEMVQAILDGRKTVTRRVIKPQPPALTNVSSRETPHGTKQWTYGFWEDGERHIMEPPYEVDDTLWVRETFTPYCINTELLCKPYPLPHSEFCYKATADKDCTDGEPCCRWHPSIHMPKEAARIFLRVTDIRVERLQDITGTEALKEGATELPCEEWVEESTVKAAFAEIWDKTVPRHPNKFKRYLYYWDDNPWVWVIEFERCEKPEGWCSNA